MKQRTNEISTARGRGHRSPVFYVARQKVRLDYSGLFLSLFLFPFLFARSCHW